MSKQSGSHKSRSVQRGSLRAMKINKITQQIQQILVHDPSLGGCIQHQKQNCCQNVGKGSDFSIPHKSSSVNKLKKTQSLSDLQLFKNKIILLEQELGKSMRQNEMLKNQNKQFSLMVSLLESEKVNLQTQIKALKQEKEQNEQEKKVKCENEDTFLLSQSRRDEQNMDEQNFPNIIQLHQQNSKLLSKIMELTMHKTQFVEGYSQTDPLSFASTEIQTDNNNFLNSLNEFCSKNNLGSPQEGVECDFNSWLENYLAIQIEKNQLPLKCQIQLFKEIITQHTKQHQQKEKKLSRLLDQSHKTITNLVSQMKKFEEESKTNYSKYLAVVRTTKREDELKN